MKGGTYNVRQYYDIKQFSRPHYDDHPQMSISDRRRSSALLQL